MTTNQNVFASSPVAENCDSGRYLESVNNIFFIKLFWRGALLCGWCTGGSEFLMTYFQVDVQRVIDEVDVDTLQRFLENITFSELDEVNRRRLFVFNFYGAAMKAQLELE